MIRSDDFLGHFEIRGFQHLSPWIPKKHHEKLTNTTQGTIEFVLRYPTLLFNEPSRWVPLLDPLSSNFRDCYGADFGLVSGFKFKLTSDKWQELQPENTKPPSKRLSRKISRVIPHPGGIFPLLPNKGNNNVVDIWFNRIGFIYKSSVWEWIAYQRFQVSPRLLNSHCYSSLIGTFFNSLLFKSKSILFEFSFILIHWNSFYWFELLHSIKTWTVN